MPIPILSFSWETNAAGKRKGQRGKEGILAGWGRSCRRAFIAGIPFKLLDRAQDDNRRSFSSPALPAVFHQHRMVPTADIQKRDEVYSIAAYRIG
jgi:hypothetical protein